MNSTNLTILIAAADQAAAQADFPDYFNTGASATGEAPAEFFFTQGFFSNQEVDFINNEATWDSMIRCHEWQQALAGEGLKMIEVPNAA